MDNVITLDAFGSLVKDTIGASEPPNGTLISFQTLSNRAFLTCDPGVLACLYRFMVRDSMSALVWLRITEGGVRYVGISISLLLIGILVQSLYGSASLDVSPLVPRKAPPIRLKSSSPSNRPLIVERSPNLRDWSPYQLHTLKFGESRTTVDYGDWAQSYYRLRALPAKSTEAVPSGEIWVSAEEGDDATAVPGDKGKPFETIGAAMEAMQSGQTLLVKSGLYRINPRITGGERNAPKAPLQLNGKQDVALIGVGNNVTISGDGSGDFLNIQNCSNVVIRNLTFEGNNPDANEEGGGLFSMILLRGENRHVTIQDCRFLNFGNHGISHLYRPKNSTFVTVEGCYFKNGGDDRVPKLNVDGAAISGVGAHWTIYNNRIERCVRGVEIEGASDRFPSENIFIHDNQITEVRDRGIMLFATNTSENKYRNITISGNMIIGSEITGLGAGHGITIDGGERLMVMNNQIRGMAGWGIGVTTGAFNDFRDGRIVNNDVEDCGTASNKGGGIVLWQREAEAFLETTVVKGNVVAGCHGPGIDVNGRSLTIVENIVYNNARSLEGPGIELSSALGGEGAPSVIKDNSCFDSQETKTQDYGIWVKEGARDAVVAGNVARDNDHADRGIRDEGEDTEVADNVTGR